MKKSISKQKNSTLLAGLTLLFAGILAASVGCSSTSDLPDTDTNTPATNETAVTETEALDPRQLVSDDLPEKDFGGQKFRIMLREEYEYEFDVKEQTGETINDTIYDRNLKVAERYNISYESTAFSAVWGEGVFNKAISNSVIADDNAYDLVVGYMCDITPTITQGLYINWYDIPHINLEKPWWAQLFTDAFTINDKIYMITGDLALSFWKGMTGIAFNKGLAADFDMENLYSVVRDGKWTFDYMESLCRQVSKDLNGDGLWDKTDMYGFATNFSTGIDAMKEAFGLHITVKDTNGIPQFDVANDRCIEVLDKLGGFFKKS